MQNRFFAELKSVQPANRRESIVALVKALLVYSPNKNKLEWIIFELRCVDPELLPKNYEQAPPFLSTNRSLV